MVATDRPAFLGTCDECGERMVEYAATAGSDYRTIQLECEDEECDNVGRVRHEAGTDATEDPDVQEGVEDLRVGKVNWIDCPHCHGSGWVRKRVDDIQPAEEQPCPRCHTSGSVIGEVSEP